MRTTSSSTPRITAMSMAVMLAALKVGLGAVGGFVALHKLATALVATKWFQDHAPAWLKMGVGVILKLIGSSAIAKAEAAGQKAVDENPPKGATETAGDAVTEI